MNKIIAFCVFILAFTGTALINKLNIQLPMIQNNGSVEIQICIFVVLLGFLFFWVTLGDMVYKYKSV